MASRSGGTLPKILVRQFSHVQLRKGLRLVGALGAGIHHQYDDSRPVHDGIGLPIDKAAVLNFAAAQQESGFGDAVGNLGGSR